jgi:hypothetical protein
MVAMVDGLVNRDPWRIQLEAVACAVFALACSEASSPDVDSSPDVGGSLSSGGSQSNGGGLAEGGIAGGLVTGFAAAGSEPGNVPGGLGGAAGMSSTATDTLGAKGSPGAAGLHIGIDYRFDSRGLFTPERRIALEAAASLWESLLSSKFDDVPAGTVLRTRPPEDIQASGIEFTLDYFIDGIAIMVGFSNIDGPGNGLASSSSSFTEQVADPDLLARLDARYHGNPFQPWVAAIGFDESENWFYDPTPDTSDDIPSDRPDLMSTALHEIGHVLGIGTSSAWSALVYGNTFTGAHAMAVVGGPVALTADGLHIDKSVLVGGKRNLMDPSTPIGTRKYPSALDLAILADLGYTLAQ